MEWSEAIDKLKPYIVRISTPLQSGTGFFVSQSTTSHLCAIATAAHVVSHADWWEEPIRLFHPASGKSRILRESDRVVHVHEKLDSAAVMFDREEFPLPTEPLELTPSAKWLLPGNEVGRLGFPSVSPADLCFFAGRVSAWQVESRTYLVDGVTIHGVSGGLAFTLLAEAEIVLVGVVSAYIANRATR